MKNERANRQAGRQFAATHTPLWLAAVLGQLFFGLIAGAADHVVSIPNKTGKTANDLHLTFGHKTGNPSCDQLTNTVGSTDGGYSYTFDTGSVPSSSSATVRWSSSYSTEQIQSGYWTFNGTNIGNFGEITAFLGYTNNPDGTAVVMFVNPQTNAVAYSNLMIFTGASQADFNPGAFVQGMTSGQFVETFVGSAGTFAPGTTILTEFRPSLAGYTAGSVFVNGGLFAFGSSPFAELSSPLDWGSQVLVQLAGDPGRNYALQSSSDLVHWNILVTNSVPDGPASFIDPTPGGRNFYRGELLASTNAPSTDGPCPGGVFTGGYTVSECISNYWNVVYYDVYACPSDWQRYTYRVKAVNTGQPCSSVLEESYLSGAAAATAVRNVSFGVNGAGFTNSNSAIAYSDTWFPAQGTIELELSTTNSGGWIMNTDEASNRVVGDAVITINGSGQAFFAIDPIGGQNPLTLPGVTSTTRVNDGLFHTLSLSYGSQGLKLYVDGALESANIENNVPLVRSSIALGDYFDAVPQSFLGCIRHLRTCAVQGNIQQPANAVAGPFNFVNRTGLTVNDFHAVFTGTGGTLNNPQMILGPAGAVIAAQGNEVDIVFPTPVAPAGAIAFTVHSRFMPIQVYSAWWTINGQPVGPATDGP